jgi:hypothetical protein
MKRYAVSTEFPDVLKDCVASETTATVYESTRRNILDYLSFQQRHSANLRCHIFRVCWLDKKNSFVEYVGRWVALRMNGSA